MVAQLEMLDVSFTPPMLLLMLTCMKALVDRYYERPFMILQFMGSRVLMELNSCRNCLKMIIFSIIRIVMTSLKTRY